MPIRPLVLIHGYSADGSAFDALRTKLIAAYQSRGETLALADINICTYVSLNNEVTITDIAEGLDRAFRMHPLLKDDTQEFDAIVHSTGMLVIRSWLVNHGLVASKNPRLKRLKHLIGLAPATWGSPQGSKGRTWMGALIKGNKEMGPDFMNAGDMVLEGLELGSSFTWLLSQSDLFGPEPYYDAGPDTPFVSVFIGNSGYTGLAALANSAAADGTVRWAGCALTGRKIKLDLTRVPVVGNDANPRVTISPQQGSIEIPMIAVDGKCHSSLIADPDDGMVEQMVNFLQVTAADPNGPAGYATYLKQAQAYGEKGLAKMLIDPAAAEGVLGKVEGLFGHHQENAIDGWQQFVMHVVDAHGQGVSDYFLELITRDAEGNDVPLQKVFEDVHAYGPDESYRCFHAKLPAGIAKGVPSLTVRLHASSGTQLVAYQGYGDDVLKDATMTADSEPVSIDISALASQAGAFFAPFRTTCVEIQINREPMPMSGFNDVLYFLGPDGTKPVSAVGTVG